MLDVVYRTASIPIDNNAFPATGGSDFSPSGYRRS
jgi:hypothetical protein